MPRGRPKKPENQTPQEVIAYFLRWAEFFAHDDPTITALRTDPTSPQHVRAVIQWAERHGYFNVAAGLRNRALPRLCDNFGDAPPTH
jgi:hypothetical protein